MRFLSDAGNTNHAWGEQCKPLAKVMIVSNGRVQGKVTSCLPAKVDPVCVCVRVCVCV